MVSCKVAIILAVRAIPTERNPLPSGILQMDGGRGREMDDGPACDNLINRGEPHPGKSESGDPHLHPSIDGWMG